MTDPTFDALTSEKRFYITIPKLAELTWEQNMTVDVSLALTEILINIFDLETTIRPDDLVRRDVKEPYVAGVAGNGRHAGRPRYGIAAACAGVPRWPRPGAMPGRDVRGVTG